MLQLVQEGVSLLLADDCFGVNGGHRLSILFPDYSCFSLLLKPFKEMDKDLPFVLFFLVIYIKLPQDWSCRLRANIWIQMAMLSLHDTLLCKTRKFAGPSFIFSIGFLLISNPLVIGQLTPANLISPITLSHQDDLGLLLLGLLEVRLLHLFRVRLGRTIVGHLWVEKSSGILNTALPLVSEI
jgi:hypothetical protein